MTFRSQLINGLWHNNQGMVALLGLCPLLAVSNSVINAMGLGIATVLVLMLSNTLIAATKRWIPRATRIPIYVTIIASVVTIVELVIQAWWYDMHQRLGVFIPLIVTNCIILARADGFAVKNTILHALYDAIAMGLGFLLILILIGGIRELLGQGTLFASAHLLFGESARVLTIQVTDFRLLISLFPAGAFITLGFIVAAKQWHSIRSASKPATSVITPTTD